LVALAVNRLAILLLEQTPNHATSRNNILVRQNAKD
jgi:hypothetical protein